MTIQQQDSTALRYFLWIVLLGLALRFVTHLRTDPVAFDSALYFEIARHIRAGAWADAMAYDFPPFYSTLIVSLQTLGILAEPAGLLISFSAGLFVLIPLFLITRLAFGATAALWAAFLWSIQPYAIRLSVRALSDAPAAILVALALWIGTKAIEKRSLGWALTSGAVSGLAYLTRPEGIEAALGLSLLYALQCGIAIRREGDTGENRGARVYNRLTLQGLVWVSAPLLGFAVIAFPYVLAISLEAGSFTISKKKSTVAMAQSISMTRAAEKTPPPRTAPAEEKMIASRIGPSVAPSPEVREKAPVGWLEKAARDLYVFQQPFVNGIHPLVLFFAALALFSKSPKTIEARAIRKLLISLLALHFVVLTGLAAAYGPDYLGGHHAFLMVLYMVPFAGSGLSYVHHWVCQKITGHRWVTATAVTLMIVAILPSTVFRPPERGQAMRLAGEWIRDQSAEPVVVVTDSAKIAFHAGAVRLPLGGEAAQIVKLAQTRGARFIALSEDPTVDRSGGFEVEVGSGNLEVPRVFSVESRRRTERVLVYRLRPIPNPDA